MVHRDYSKRGESVRVFCYPDRVDIHSPGLLLPGITVEQMERGEVQSKLRSPALANLLKDIPGYMERLGSCSGRFDLPAQTMSMLCILTGELTGEPIDNNRFSSTPVEVERRERERQPQTPVDGLCRWRDSNPQPLRDLFLRQARIPFRHTGLWVV